MEQVQGLIFSSYLSILKPFSKIIYIKFVQFTVHLYFTQQFISTLARILFDKNSLQQQYFRPETNRSHNYIHLSDYVYPHGRERLMGCCLMLEVSTGVLKAMKTAMLISCTSSFTYICNDHHFLVNEKSTIQNNVTINFATP